MRGRKRKTKATTRTPSQNKRLNTGTESGVPIVRSLDTFPAEIQRLILQFLPPKDRFKARVWSKHWNATTTTLPTLELNEGSINQPPSPPRKKLFTDYVQLVLFSHDLQYLRDFRLRCYVGHDGDRVNNWVNSVVKCNLHTLSLILNGTSVDFSLLPVLFSSTKLLHLRIGMSSPLRVPTSDIVFPTLRTLDLRSVRFPDPSMVQFLSKCPALEDLTLDGCCWGQISKNIIMIPTVVRITVCAEYLLAKKPAVLFEMVEDDCQVEFHAPKLKRFEYAGDLTCFYSLHNVPLLDEACVTLGQDNWKERSTLHMSGLIRNLAQMTKVLKLLNCSLQALDRSSDLFDSLKFVNLTSLEVNFPDSGGQSSAVVQIMRRAPNLETLIMHGGIRMAALGDPVPQCLSSSLRIVKIYEYQERFHKEGLLELLAHSVTLETLTLIAALSCLNEEMMRSMLQEYEQKFSEYPRASKDCKVIVDYMRYV